MTIRRPDTTRSEAPADRAGSEPALSIVMPVFNTGRMLLASVTSVLRQSLFESEAPGYWELIIVDDGSTDPATREALAEAESMSTAVRVVANTRQHGVAGARNAGIDAARGTWIAFLDSDDLWYRDFLSRQRDAFDGFPDADWRAAHFDIGDEAAKAIPTPLERRSPCLHEYIASDYTRGEVSVLKRPVDVLLRCGCLQIMTIQIRRELIRAHGGFDETLASAEDYDLWLRLAATHDLYIAPIDAGVYRMHSGSLTRSGHPQYYCEDRMLEAARERTEFTAFRADIDRRLRLVYSTFCFHFREHGEHRRASQFALKLIRLAPAKFDGWRHLAASTLHR